VKHKSMTCPYNIRHILQFGVNFLFVKLCFYKLVRTSVTKQNPCFDSAVNYSNYTSANNGNAVSKAQVK